MPTTSISRSPTSVISSNIREEGLPTYSFKNPDNLSLFSETIMPHIIEALQGQDVDSIRCTARSNIPTDMAWPQDKPLTISNLKKISAATDILDITAVEEPPIESLRWLCLSDDPYAEQLRNALGSFSLAIPQAYDLEEALFLVDKILDLPRLRNFHLDMKVLLANPDSLDSITPDSEQFLLKLLNRSFDTIAISFNIPNLFDRKAWSIFKRLQHVTSFGLESSGVALTSGLQATWDEINANNDRSVYESLLIHLREECLIPFLERNSELEYLDLPHKLEADGELLRTVSHFVNGNTLKRFPVWVDAGASIWHEVIPLLPNLEGISLLRASEEVLAEIRNFHHLKSISILNSNIQNDDAILSIVVANPNLESLHFIRCTGITKDCMSNLLRSAPKIKSFAADNCRGIGTEGPGSRGPDDDYLRLGKNAIEIPVKLPKLESLSFRGYQAGVDPRLLFSITMLIVKGILPQLKMINVDGSMAPEEAVKYQNLDRMEDQIMYEYL